MKWGRFFWTTIHVAALGYPDIVTDTTREQYKAFFISLGNVLPCGKCRRNYATHMDELPIDFYLFDKHTLFAWTVSLHNIVNRDTNKPEWSVEDAKEFYTKGKYADKLIDESKSKNTNDVLLLMNSCLLFVLVALFVWKMLKK